MSKLIKNVYQVRNYDNIAHEIDRRRKIQGDDEAWEASHANRQYEAEIQQSKNLEVTFSDIYRDKTRIKPSDMSSLLFPFLNRTRLKYTILNAF